MSTAGVPASPRSGRGHPVNEDRKEFLSWLLIQFGLKVSRKSKGLQWVSSCLDRAEIWAGERGQRGLKPREGWCILEKNDSKLGSGEKRCWAFPQRCAQRTPLTSAPPP